MRRLSTLVGAGLLCAALSTSSLADDLSVTGDTYTQADSPTANFGSSGITAVAVGRTTLLQFNAAAIAQTSGSKAKLNIRVVLAKNATDGVSARLITSAWNEKTVTAKTLPSIAATALDRQTITKANQGQVVSFDVSGALASWRSTPSTNFGIALVPDSPTPNLQLGSREGGSPAILSLGGVAADNDVTVAVSGGDYPDPQSAADNAFAGDKWCVSPQPPTKPCTIHVKSGIYPKGSVALPAGLALIGEDRGSTILLGHGVSLPSGLVSDLTLQGGGIHRSENSGVGGATVIEVDRVSINLRNQVTAVGLTQGFGSFTLADSQISAINTLPTLPLILFDCEGATGCTSVKVLHSQITGIAPAGGVAFSYSGDAQQALQLEDTSVLMSESSPAIDSSGQGLKVTIVGGQINGGITGTEGGDSLDVIDAVINGGIDWVDSGSLTLEGATVNGGLSFASDFGLQQVSVMRSTINGGASVSAGVLELESSVVAGNLNLFGSRGTLKSAQVTGTILLQSEDTQSTATCDRVFDGNLVLRPANCVGP